MHKLEVVVTVAKWSVVVNVFVFVITNSFLKLPNDIIRYGVLAETQQRQFFDTATLARV